jgi:secreted trypsin-like serine protease
MPRLRTLLPMAALAAALLAPSSASAVVGGQDASRPYPHMAELRLDGDYICGASLVAPNKILTAAHCVEGEKASSLSFVLGRPVRSDTSQGEEIPASSLTIHPQYDPNTQAYDVAVVTLSRSSTAGSPIALADPVADRGLWEPGDDVRVIGWGTRVGFDLVGLTITDQLQEVDVPIVDDAECDQNYTLMGGIDEATMVCAGNLHGTEDSCQGDSGGPLMGLGTGGELRQVGVVSWGFGCGYPTQYGVYSRVGDALLGNWVRSQIGQQTAATKAKRAKAKKRKKARRTKRAARRTGRA